MAETKNVTQGGFAVKDTEIIEGNRLIEKFDGWERVYPGTASKVNRGLAQFKNKDGRTWSCYISDGIGANVVVPFDKSWDLLMPVVEKIESLGEYQIEIELFSCYIIEIKALLKKGQFVVESHENSKIKAVWLAVVEFIKWNNQDK